MEASSKSGEDGKIVTHFISVLEISFFQWILIKSYAKCIYDGIVFREGCLFVLDFHANELFWIEV